jgi:hypothetical protein
MSAATLSQDEANLAAAITQYNSDKGTSITVLAADKAKVLSDGKGVKDPAVAPLMNTWQQAMLARKSTLLTDYTTMKTTTNADKINILKDDAAILADKASGNTDQLALDKAQRSKDRLQLATDRANYGTTFANDNITTKATVAADHQAILAQRLADNGNTQRILDQEQLVSDRQKWVDTLAADHKIVLADQLIVAQDKHA